MTEITDEMVEAGAEVLYEHTTFNRVAGWDDIDERERVGYRDTCRAILEAAPREREKFSMPEVRRVADEG